MLHILCCSYTFCIMYSVVDLQACKHTISMTHYFCGLIKILVVCVLLSVVLIDVYMQSHQI